MKAGEDKEKCAGSGSLIICWRGGRDKTITSSVDRRDFGIAKRLAAQIALAGLMPINTQCKEVIAERRSQCLVSL
jgi:hypothetical protein